MTKQEIIAYGQTHPEAKLSHRYFSDDEHISYTNKWTIKTEEGYEMDADEFLKYREQAAAFDDGWSIKE